MKKRTNKQTQLIQDEKDLLSCPGVTIRETMESKNWDATMVALSLGISVQDTNLLLDGKLEIDELMAFKLERLTGVDEEFWINLERLYREKLQRLNEQQ